MEGLQQKPLDDLYSTKDLMFTVVDFTIFKSLQIDFNAIQLL